MDQNVSKSSSLYPEESIHTPQPYIETMGSHGIDRMEISKKVTRKSKILKIILLRLRMEAFAPLVLAGLDATQINPTDPNAPDSSC